MALDARGQKGDRAWYITIMRRICQKYRFWSPVPHESASVGLGSSRNMYGLHRNPGNSDSLLVPQIQFYVFVLFISVFGFITLPTSLPLDNLYPFWVI